MSQFAITRGDIFGGLTAGVVALPLCLAFGVASGLGAAAGPYGGIILGIVASLVGGTPVQVSGPTAPMTLVSAGVVAANTLPTGEVNLSDVFGVFVLAGALQALFGIARLGRYVRFLPYPVISGLMTGIGLIISLANAMNLIADSGVRTKADLLAVEFTMSAGDVENLISLPPGWFSSRAADVVQLKQGMAHTVTHAEGAGIVVPFNRLKDR